MAVTRDLATPLIEALVQVYIDAQAQLALAAAAQLRKGIDSPDWVSEKNAAARDLETTLRKILQRLGRQTSGRLADAVAAAYAMGGQAAAEEVASHMTAEGAARAAVQLPQSAAVQRLVLSQVSKLGGTHLPVLRSVMDAYRQAVAAGGAGDVLTGVSTRRQATQRAWSRLLDQGITSFTDAAGRRQNLASYAEMAMRTTVAHAAVEGHLDKLDDLGLDLVVVSNSAQECKLCRPWEGKILSRSGGGERTVLAENPATGKTMSVAVAGSVDEAIRGGLMHPNCRHSLSAYFPGLTEIPTNTSDPEGDAERQRLRALERRIRRLRTQELGALDDKAREHYGRLATKAQSDIREYVKGKDNLMRKPERELVNLGHKRAAAATTATKTTAKKATAKKVASPKTAKAPATPRPVKPKPDKRPPEVIAAEYNAKVGNPPVLTGNKGSWFDQIPHDTGIDHPIPVRNYEVSGYVVKEGQIWRIDGKSYLVEKRTDLDRFNYTDAPSKTTEQILPARQVVEEFQDIHRSLPDADKYQDGYAWLAGRNPADEYWEKKYGIPDFESLATAGDRGVRIWARRGAGRGPSSMKDTLDHEFGHNVSNAARRLSPPLDDHSEAWDDAVTGETSKMPLGWSPGWLATSRKIRFGRGTKGAAPKGCTEYGTSSEAENYAESMGLYLAGPIGKGQLRAGGPVVDLFFRDIWPKRAALFDRLFPGVASKQRVLMSLRPK